CDAHVLSIPRKLAQYVRRKARGVVAPLGASASFDVHGRAAHAHRAIFADLVDQLCGLWLLARRDDAAEHDLRRILATELLAMLAQVSKPAGEVLFVAHLRRARGRRYLRGVEERIPAVGKLDGAADRALGVPADEERRMRLLD